MWSVGREVARGEREERPAGVGERFGALVRFNNSRNIDKRNYIDFAFFLPFYLNFKQGKGKVKE